MATSETTINGMVPVEGPWTTYGVAPEVWREVADQHAERGELPTAAQVDEATGCGAAAAAAAVEAFALYHELGELLAAGSPAAARNRPAPGSLYLDPGDGELVQVLPASAWDPYRWGPPAALPVVRILAPGARDRWSKPGEIAQRDLTGLTLVPPAAVGALRALAGGVLASLATAAAKRADAIGCGFATQGGGMPEPGWVAGLARAALARGNLAEVAALALFGLSLAGAEGAEGS